MAQELRQKIQEISPAELHALRENEEDFVLIDVREQDEYDQGYIPGAVHIPRGFLELRIEEKVPDRSTPIVAYCAVGFRSLFSAETLERMGYEEVSSLSGGYNKWKQGEYEVKIPRVLSAQARKRYSRHLLIPEVQEEGQLRLLNSKVLMVGAGGLGSPSAFYLAAAGVGTLGIVDFDDVDMSNLQRQILHTDDRVGTPKAESARKTLTALNPDIRVVPHKVRLGKENVDEIFKDYDIIVDGTDNFPTRYLINDACVKLGKLNVHGSVYRFEGQVTVFCAPGGPCYRCLYPEPPPPELAPSCAEAGVLGVLPGVVGLLQAVETVKLILGVGESMAGKLLHYEALNTEFRKLKLRRDPQCSYCGEKVKEFPGYADYEFFCANPSGL
ncbi:MAG: molybdopterin-synthase adenylyltransferase MoeB [Candidatus Omnitrophica bacterium]|nr:molybdopterin-synthase adenylyltransferase MoeB [Candidatus Omnitrophota bacterium]